MNARRHRTAGILNRNPPKIPQPKWIRLSSRQRGVVQVETIFTEKGLKGHLILIITLMQLQKGRSNLRQVHFALGFVIQQPFTGWTNVSAKIGICLDGRAIDVKRIHICRHRPGLPRGQRRLPGPASLERRHAGAGPGAWWLV